MMRTHKDKKHRDPYLLDAKQLSPQQLQDRYLILSVVYAQLPYLWRNMDEMNVISDSICPWIVHAFLCRVRKLTDGSVTRHQFQP